LIVSPKTAAHIAKQAFLDHNPIDSFLTNQQAEDLLSNPPYEVREIEGKGMGAVAARKIKKFETIMVDQASLVQDLEAEKVFSKREQRKMLAMAVKQLRRPEAVRKLSANHADHDEDSANALEGRLEADIIRTNAFGSEIVGRKVRTLFPLISVSRIAVSKFEAVQD